MNEQIRERAYRIWESEGRPHGRALEHWLQAERELAAAAEPGTDTGSRRGKEAAAKKRGAGRSRGRSATHPADH